MIRFGLPLGEGRAEYSPSPTSSWFPVSCAGEGHSLSMGYGCTWALGLLTTGSPKQPSAAPLQALWAQNHIEIQQCPTSGLL